MDGIMETINTVMYNPFLIVTILIFGGLIVGFAGYKLFKIYSAVIGFAVGIILGYYISLLLFGAPSLITYLAAGVVLAVIFWLFHSAGLFITSIVIGYMFLSSLLPEKMLYSYVFAFLCGILVLFLERALITIITALLGATAITVAVEMLISGRTVYEFLLDPRNALSVAFSSPLLFLLWLVMGVIGVVTQIVLTKETSSD
ncbi:MAG: DUF4203 domain-containing protein [Candidatus Methanoglobus sp.]